MFKKLLACVTLLGTFTLAFAAVDINKASESELDGIKGVGPATTQQIMAERKKADFKNWEDLMARIKGIGPARAAKLSAEGMTIGGASYKPMVTAVEPKNDKKKSSN